jgi:hypothetical protein
MYHAFLEIRVLGWEGKAEQAAELADAFHNLPNLLFSDHFDWDSFRDLYLADYQQKYPRPQHGMFDYVARFDEIVKNS